MDLETTLAIATAAAKDAGAALLRDFRHGIRGEAKGLLDVVTEADRESERLLRVRLLGAFPADAFLGEEDGAAGPRSSRVWVVDPLDGTVNYLHGHPFFCLSVGLVVDGIPTAGVIEAPALGWTFAASRGRGATRNGLSIRVSSTAALGDSLVATGFPGASHADPEPFLAAVAEILRRTHGIRRCGAAALDLALTADGTYDAYYEMALHPWDVAAGVLLVREAGGRVTDYAGAEADVSGRSVLASNGRIHDALLALLRGTRLVPPA
jgi:myo-inositol-1(or 4)-monophosphatase